MESPEWAKTEEAGRRVVVRLPAPPDRAKDDGYSSGKTAVASIRSERSAGLVTGHSRRSCLQSAIARTSLVPRCPSRNKPLPAVACSSAAMNSTSSASAGRCASRLSPGGLRARRADKLYLLGLAKYQTRMIIWHVTG